MKYYFLCEEFLKYIDTNDIEISIKNYINNNYEILNDIYFTPKKIDKDKIEDVIKDKEYKNLLLNMISNLKNIDLEKTFANIIDKLGNILNYKNVSKKIYVIIGLNTTTIYSTKYKNEDVTVILLESSLGLEENIKMLLAHEYTHWIREKEIKHDIFESCIGERFITEGIACNFSEEIVPNNKKSYYCIVPDEAVKWVENNMQLLDKMVQNELYKKDMMYDFFYMFAKTKLPDMPARTGYVYGYLKVKKYIEKYSLKVKDIVNIDWKIILKENQGEIDYESHSRLCN
ncbi:MAG: DUF2268 domain-containing protein [Clostridia bacterium]|nr:DUF2268 domain-containing protein [Clostridia bacterium]